MVPAPDEHKSRGEPSPAAALIMERARQLYAGGLSEQALNELRGAIRRFPGEKGAYYSVSFRFRNCNADCFCMDIQSDKSYLVHDRLLSYVALHHVGFSDS
jgi:hypothetical protein